MLKRTILATAAVAALAVGIQAQEGATLVLRSGDKVSGQLIDMGGSGFALRVNGEDRQIGSNDVAVIDFGGNGDLSDADWAKVGNGPAVLLRNGQAVAGQLTDIGGTSPLRISVRTDAGTRDFQSSEISRIVLARPTTTAAAGSTASASSPSIPAGTGVAVDGTQAWTPTGIAVRRGDSISFAATGEVQLSADGADLAAPNGAKSGRMAVGSPLPQVPAGALIGRIGNSAPFAVGGNQTITMPGNGQLFLGINDDHTGDNKGGYRVVMQRQGRR